MKTKKEPKLNRKAVAILLLVIEHIKEHPDVYDQNWDSAPPIDLSCKTSRCIMGWFKVVRTLLKIEDGLLTDRQFNILYDYDQWPKKYQTAESWSEVTVDEAVARILHFIKTDGQK